MSNPICIEHNGRVLSAFTRSIGGGVMVSAGEVGPISSIYWIFQVNGGDIERPMDIVSPTDTRERIIERLKAWSDTVADGSDD